MPILYLGLGSNLGDGRANLDRAIELLSARLGAPVAVSSYLVSEPWGFESEHRFTNAVAAFETDADPWDLLDMTQSIEREMGRTVKHRPGESYTDRIIDIDLLEYGDWHIESERLSLPHPLIAQRDFVLMPLMECKNSIK